VRQPIIVANWKMNKHTAEASDFGERFCRLDIDERVEVVICPPFVSLETCHRIFGHTKVKIGAQNVHWEKSGAFTGEISTQMLSYLGCEYVVVGHSERRQMFCETDDTVAKKTAACLRAGLSPIVCVGETLAERKQKMTREVVRRQARAALSQVRAQDLARIVVAYEPVWAIGSGTPATAEDALAVASELRMLVTEMFENASAERIRVQYGGSVNADNIADFMQSADIDGALVGGASLEPEGFAGLVNSALSKRV